MDLAEHLVWFVSGNWALFVCFTVTIVYLLFHSTKQRKNFPPGPRGFPILGVAPFVSRRPEITFAKWAKKYGDIMGFKVGNNYTVVLSSYDVIQEALVKYGPYFNDRPDNFIFTDVLRKNGLAFHDYTPNYITERKFVLATLNRLGFGKTSMETSVIDEAMRLLEQYGDNDIELNQDVKMKLMYSMANVVAQMTIGKRYTNYQDRDFRAIMDGWLYFMHEGSLTYLVTMILPWLRYVPPIRGSAMAVKRGISNVCDVASKEIAEHEKTLDMNSTRDFIDEYLTELKKKTEQEKGPYSKDMLACMIRDFFGAGMETVTSTIIFTLLVLANRPEIMKRIHDEIDAVIGRGEALRYALREKMPFTHACIVEVMRYRTVGPLSVPHCTSENIKFRGYYIPKGTTVLPSIYSVHNDPRIWNKPDEFNPERHLDSGGKVHVTKYFMPFGFGPRLCIGSRLAEMELFIFLVTIFRRYDVVPTPTSTCERPHVNDDSNATGLTLCPPENTPITLVRR